MTSTYLFTETDWFMDGRAPDKAPDPTPYHRPVMLKECIRELEMTKTGTYVDCTFGGGGHSELMIQLLGEKGRLIAFDQDADAYKNAKTWQYPNFSFVRANFRYLGQYLQSLRASPVDGILADLGISSYQIDEPSKGFSTRFEGPLDMRMNASQDLSAEDVVNSYELDDLTRIFREYGEVENPRRLAERIIQERSKRQLTTTAALCEAITPLAPRKKEYKYFAQVFQAIRIEVNDEMAALREMLEQGAANLRPGGRFVVLTYHSLEDRLVKNYFAKGKFEGEVDKDLYGNEINKPLNPAWRKAIVATEEEVRANPRARSAKLRVGVKI